jgi:hypothetical protein
MDEFAKIMLMAGLMLAIMLGVPIYMALNSTETTQEQYVYNMGSDLGVEGHFVLGSGNVESVPVYVYFVKKESGAYAMKYVDAGKTDLFMDENDNPYISKDFECKFGYGTYNPEENSGCYLQHAEFHVPNGTLVRAYSAGVK